ncbi:DUF3604 domain-containing protein [Tropicimonas aquimaris]|uniref:DUF3604 domain-containing protein n=1 Tax=Tropicimonas aquimaris TaxID=914152 RepID=A0ABW3IPQ6_9RHOB
MPAILWHGTMRKHAREAFVTSGPRIQPRFFGGASLATHDDPVRLVVDGYANRAPMCGTLTALDGPSQFTVQARKDRESANRDRIQFGKGWGGDAGQL